MVGAGLNWINKFSVLLTRNSCIDCARRSVTIYSDGAYCLRLLAETILCPDEEYNWPSKATPESLAEAGGPG